MSKTPEVAPANRTPSRMATVALIAALLNAGAAGVVEAQVDSIDGVFADAVGPDFLPDEPGVTTIRRRLVQIDMAPLAMAQARAASDARGDGDGASLTLNLFDDLVLSGIVEHAEPTASGSGYALSGRLRRIGDGDDGTVWEMTLLVYGEMVAGTVRTTDEIYEIRSVGNGTHAITQVEFTLPPGDEPLMPPSSVSSNPDAGTSGTTSDADSPVAAADDGSTIDVAVFYTPAAATAARGSSAVANITQLIDKMFVDSNNAYRNSGVSFRINQVRREEVIYSESGSSKITRGRDLDRLRHPRDSYMDGVHQIRDTVGADLVHLIVDWTEGSSCGIAYYLSNPRPDGAFGITHYSCHRQYSFTHELGHNMGLQHDRYAEDGGSPSLYNYGYVNRRAVRPNPPASALWRTIMAYNEECADQRPKVFCDRIPRFSNPDQSYQGYPLGIPYNSSSSADARRTLNETRTAVANFRTRRPTGPTGPTGTASLSPNPATVSFTSDGAWHAFTLNASTPVRVVANPSGTPRVEITDSSTSGNFCPAEQNDDLTRSNGQTIYLAGCAGGTGTVQLVRDSDGTVLRTYTFTIGGGGPSGTASLSPDPASVSFTSNGAWRAFTVNASTPVRVVANPSGTPRVEITDSSTSGNFCPAEQNDDLTRSNGQTVYLAGCANGTGTVQLVRDSDGTVLRTYTFTIGGGGPSGTASLSPDPASVSFTSNGAWRAFTVNASTPVRVVANPSGTPRVEITDSSTSGNFCPAEQNDDLTRSNGQTVYLAGCANGTGTVQLVRDSDGTVLRTYTFTIGGGGPSGTASLSPDPASVSFTSNGAWRAFTVNASTPVRVVANPSGTPRVEITDSSTSGNFCPAEQNDDLTRSNGQTVYLAGCVNGTGTIQLVRDSDNTVLRTYTFNIGGGAPSGTASLSPDPSTVSFTSNGAWRAFTVNASTPVRVVANPSGTPRVEITDSSTSGNFCPAEQNDDLTRSNGQTVYLAGCVNGTGTVQLVRDSDNTVLRTYTFNIGGGAPSGTASLSPDPSTVSFTSNGAWRAFTVNASTPVRVVANPSGTPRVEITDSSTSGNFCPAEQNDDLTRSNGQTVYLAGCANGTGTVQLVRDSDGTVLRTYTFTIGGGGPSGTASLSPDPASVSFTSNGAWRAFTVNASTPVRVVANPSGTPRVEITDSSTSGNFCPAEQNDDLTRSNGQTVYLAGCANGTGTVQLVRDSDGTVLRTYTFTIGGGGPSGTASLSPDPASVSFTSNGAWRAFTVNASTPVRVVANPSGTPRVEITDSSTSGNFCPAEQNDDLTRSNGQTVYLAGCANGTGTVQLVRDSDNTVLRTYTFNIGGGAPSGTASLSPDPASVSFTSNGAWRAFTVNASTPVRVVANPSGTPRVEITDSSTSGNFCPAEQNDDLTRSNGQTVYLAGCANGTGTVQLVRDSDGTVLRTYTFTIGGGGPSGTASLSPDPASVSFTSNGAWRAFTVNASTPVRVVANPSGTPRVEITDSSTSGNFCPAEQNDDLTRSNGQTVYLAGCVNGTGTIQLVRDSDSTVLRTYTFTIGGSSAGCTNNLGSVSGTVTRTGSWTGSCLSVHYSLGEYARYYSFTLGGSAPVTMDLTSSSVNTWLALRNGTGTGTGLIESDDDDGVGTNARISRTLSAGTYTIEATTLRGGVTGPFTLTLRVGSGGSGNRPTFVDHPIVPGVTPVRAIHFTELRTRIDALREAAGLQAFPWTDRVLTAGETPVRLVHLLELREALAAAYAAGGQRAPSWTDAAAGATPLKAAHLMELRTAVMALE